MFRSLLWHEPEHFVHDGVPPTPQLIAKSCVFLPCFFRHLATPTIVQLYQVQFDRRMRITGRGFQVYLELRIFLRIFAKRLSAGYDARESSTISDFLGTGKWTLPCSWRRGHGWRR